MNLYTNTNRTKKMESKEIFALTFELLETAEGKEDLYISIANKNLAKQLINLYYLSFETDYESMIYNFKKKYIENEAKVEYNDGDKAQELVGLGYMYDYIQDYKPNENSFNIFMECMKLHKLLYKDFDDKYKEEREKQYNEYKEKLEIAKRNKDMIEYRRISSLMKSSNEVTSSYGGNLRNYEVDLNGIDYHVPSVTEARVFLNSFLNPEKMTEYQNILSSSDIFGYIEYCVKTCVDIIKYQPFGNGNKRTARALLNLMFKNRNIPPVYIVQRERDSYKEALFKAITAGDYTDITNFYYFKICDSIYELDILPYIESKENTNKIVEKDSGIVENDVRLYDTKRR